MSGPKQDNSVPETAQEQALSKVAMEQFKRYKQDFVPFEDKFIADVTGATAAREEAVAGATNADLAQKRVTAINPNMRAAFSAKRSVGEATTGARALNAAIQNVEDQSVSGKQAVIDMGRGQATEANLGMQGLAANAVQTATNDAVARQQERAAMGDAVGSAIGSAAAIIPWGGAGMNRAGASALDIGTATTAGTGGQTAGAISSRAAAGR